MAPAATIMLENESPQPVVIGSPTDRELLGRFLAGDGVAFSEVVRRHESLVFNICLRVLRSPADAEDAFQATFLVLARRARFLKWHDSVAGWLHQTARRTALKYRAISARRRQMEGQAAQQVTHRELLARNPASLLAIRELGEILDDELAALPARFREVILLSQVEGLARDDIAERLGVSLATVKDRLERGREQLRLRLVRRGVALTSAALAAWLMPTAAQAASMTTLAATTSQAACAFSSGSLAAGTSPVAATLAQGVLKMMGFEKLKYVTAWVVTLLTAGGIAYGMLQDEPQRFDKGLRGDVVAVNLAGKTPTVTVKLDGEVLLNLDLAPTAKVWTAFEPGKLADLQPERFVSLRLGPDHRTVQEVHLLGRQREVTIRSVEPSGKITAVEGYWDEGDQPDEPWQPQEFQLAQDAILRINGLPASKDDLKPGMKVPLEFSSDGRKVNAIEADGDATLIMAGEIFEVQPQDKIVKLRVWDEEAHEEEGRIVTLSVLTDTLILLDGKPGKLDRLPLHGEITVRLHEDRTSIRSLRATTPTPEDPAEMEAEMNGENQDGSAPIDNPHSSDP